MLEAGKHLRGVLVQPLCVPRRPCSSQRGHHLFKSTRDRFRPSDCPLGHDSQRNISCTQKGLTRVTHDVAVICFFHPEHNFPRTKSKAARCREKSLGQDGELKCSEGPANDGCQWGGEDMVTVIPKGNKGLGFKDREDKTFQTFSHPWLLPFCAHGQCSGTTHGSSSVNGSQPRPRQGSVTCSSPGAWRAPKQRCLAGSTRLNVA